MTVDPWSVLEATGEHIGLTAVSVAIAVVIGVPLGTYLVRHRFLAAPVLGFVGMLQTIPSLALLGLLIPVLGIGVKPALLALFLYALLPIVQNTFSGLDSVDRSIVDAARGMGMEERQILRRITLPLARPVILAGIRTSTTISIGVATLAAYVGAGGLGDFIFRGISMVNMELVSIGAIPAALLAIVTHIGLGWAERWVTPRGMRKS